VPAIDKYLFPQSSIFFSVPTDPFSKNVLSHFPLYVSLVICCRFPVHQFSNAQPHSGYAHRLFGRKALGELEST
jgi:hypothetical protein